MRILLLPLLIPLAVIYSLASFVRGRLFDFGILKSYKVSTKVLCVGNLTSGGTGKTPLIHWLAQELKKRGKRVVILSRGYKRQSDSILKVPTSALDVSSYGDEPLQLAKQLPEISVYVGADRVAAAQTIIHLEQPDVILLDDGFQHRRLQRDMDFVVLDATEPPWHYWSLPLGLARESSWALRRASAVVFTKTNLAAPNWTPDAFKNVRLTTSQREKVLTFTSNLRFLRSPEGVRVPITDLLGRKVGILSALGRPEAFEKQLREAGFEVCCHQKFPDHHNYTEREVNQFFGEAHKVGAEFFLVTEKDFVKLARFVFPKEKLFVAEQEIQLSKGQEEFDRLMHRLFS